MIHSDNERLCFPAEPFYFPAFACLCHEPQGSKISLKDRKGAKNTKKHAKANFYKPIQAWTT